MTVFDGRPSVQSAANVFLLREKLLAEFVGTFFLVFTVGIAATGPGPAAPVAIGMILAIQIYCFGGVSGGMFNPAVTLSVWLSGRNQITPENMGMYMGIQTLGGIVGGALAFGVTKNTFAFSIHAFDAIGDKHGDGMASFFLETFFTMALCGAVLSTGTSQTDTPNQYFGFAIGGTVIAAATACGGFDQGSFNPAVTIGINIAHAMNGKKMGPTVKHDAVSYPIFILCPLLGGVLAAIVFRLTRQVEYDEDLGGMAGVASGARTSLAQAGGQYAQQNDAQPSAIGKNAPGTE